MKPDLAKNYYRAIALENQWLFSRTQEIQKKKRKPCLCGNCRECNYFMMLNWFDKEIEKAGIPNNV